MHTIFYLWHEIILFPKFMLSNSVAVVSELACCQRYSWHVDFILERILILTKFRVVNLIFQYSDSSTLLRYPVVNLIQRRTFWVQRLTKVTFWWYTVWVFFNKLPITLGTFSILAFRVNQHVTPCSSAFLTFGYFNHKVSMVYFFISVISNPFKVYIVNIAWAVNEFILHGIPVLLFILRFEHVFGASNHVEIRISSKFLTVLAIISTLLLNLNMYIPTGLSIQLHELKCIFISSLVDL